MTTFLVSAPNEFVADIICQQLAQGGIKAIPKGTSVKPGFLGGGQQGQDIYVEDADLDRAREILREAESAADELPEDAVEPTQAEGMDPETGQP